MKIQIVFDLLWLVCKTNFNTDSYHMPYTNYFIVCCILSVIQATGARLGVLVQSLSSIGVGIVIGFIFSWKLTLVILIFLPALGIAGFLEVRMIQGYANAGQAVLEDASKVCLL